MRKTSDSSPPEPLSLEDALALLPDEARLHCWRNNGLGLMQSKWRREDVVRLIEAKGARLADPAARRLGHGLRVDDDLGTLFIETRDER